jgi:hypothetical protein
LIIWVRSAFQNVKLADKTSYYLGEICRNQPGDEKHFGCRINTTLHKSLCLEENPAHETSNNHGDLSILAAGNALAADLLPVPPPQAPVFVTAPAIHNWAGVYVGINGGWASEALNETPVRPGRCRARSTTTAGSSGAHSA